MNIAIWYPIFYLLAQFCGSTKVDTETPVGRLLETHSSIKLLKYKKKAPRLEQKKKKVNDYTGGAEATTGVNIY